MKHPFLFVGALPASKSLMNRALIVKSFFPELQIKGHSQCEDVQLMADNLQKLSQGETVFDCGHAGTVLRFLALRLSRETGEFFLEGSERLFSRPQDDLMRVLQQLGAEVQIKDSKLILRSRGWKYMGDALYVSGEKSSQFASAVMLSSWKIDKPLHVVTGMRMASPRYFEMTLRFLSHLGLHIERETGEFIIFPSQKLENDFYEVEPDMSSAFAVVALALVAGQAKIKNFPMMSWQPDAQFPQILRDMGVKLEINNGQLFALETHKFKALQFNMDRAPDLFPVLAVLCAHAEGVSFLLGAKQLAYKESNRIKKVAELLDKMGKSVVIHDDGLQIKGHTDIHSRSFEFDPDQDHRLAMAAGVAKKMGYEVTILHRESVNKSFPEFWQISGL